MVIDYHQLPKPLITHQDETGLMGPASEKTVGPYNYTVCEKWEMVRVTRVKGFSIVNTNPNVPSEGLDSSRWNDIGLSTY